MFKNRSNQLFLVKLNINRIQYTRKGLVLKNISLLFPNVTPIQFCCSTSRRRKLLKTVPFFIYQLSVTELQLFVKLLLLTGNNMVALQPMRLIFSKKYYKKKIFCNGLSSHQVPYTEHYCSSALESRMSNELFSRDLVFGFLWGSYSHNCSLQVEVQVYTDRYKQMSMCA